MLRRLKFRGLAIALAIVSVASTVGAQDETQRLVAQLLAPPPLKAAAGFTARLLVPPGRIYDPLYMIVRGTGVWVTDDGGRADKVKGGRFLEVDRTGRVTVLSGLGQVKPLVAADIAPAGFGPYAGQVFAIVETQPDSIQRIDLATSPNGIDVCVLPGDPAVQGSPRGGWDAQFGPNGTAFAGRFYAIAGGTIYAVTPDGKCERFITFDRKGFSGPLALLFEPGGKTVLVSGQMADRPTGKAGAIARVAADGAVDPKLVLEGIERPTGFAVAPSGFGQYGGQLFVADAGDWEIPVPGGRALRPDGKVFRQAPDGTLHLVAEGLVNPIDVAFVNGRLWVTDLNGDFLFGRELPDGFMVEIGVR